MATSCSIRSRRVKGPSGSKAGEPAEPPTEIGRSGSNALEISKQLATIALVVSESASG